MNQPPSPPPRPRPGFFGSLRFSWTLVLGIVLGATLGAVAVTAIVVRMPRQYAARAVIDCRPARTLLANRKLPPGGLEAGDFEPSGYPVSDMLLAATQQALSRVDDGTPAPLRPPLRDSITIKSSPDQAGVFEVTIVRADPFEPRLLLDAYVANYSGYLSGQYHHDALSRLAANDQTLAQLCFLGFENRRKLVARWNSVAAAALWLKPQEQWISIMNTALEDLETLRQGDEDDQFFDAAHHANSDNREALRRYDEYSKLSAATKGDLEARDFNVKWLRVRHDLLLLVIQRGTQLLMVIDTASQAVLDSKSAAGTPAETIVRELMAVGATEIANRVEISRELDNRIASDLAEIAKEVPLLAVDRPDRQQHRLVFPNPAMVTMAQTAGLLFGGLVGMLLVHARARHCPDPPAIKPFTDEPW